MSYLIFYFDKLLNIKSIIQHSNWVYPTFNWLSMFVD